MNAFKAALQQYLKQELNFSVLESALSQDLQAKPHLLPEFMSYLKDLQESETLTTQDYAKLHTQILQFKKHSRQQSASEGEKPLSIEQRGQWRDGSEWTEGWEKQALFVPGAEKMLKQTYRLKNSVAHLRIGELWRAVDLGQDERSPLRQVAILLLAPGVICSQQNTRMLLNEFPRYQSLEHPHLLSILEIGREGGSVFISMSLPVGEPVQTLLNNNPHGIPLLGAKELLTDLAQVLDFCLEQDSFPYCTPDTLFYDPVQKKLQFMHFGLLNLVFNSVEQIRQEAEEAPLNLAYLSCELLSGLHRPDATDLVYNFGCLAYELLSGRHPYARKTCLEAKERQFMPNPVGELNVAQWQTLQQALSFEQAQRLPQCSRLLVSLYPLPSNRWPWVVSGTAALGLLLVGALYLNNTVWEYQRVREGIINGDSQSITRLQSWDEQRQLQLIEGGPSAVGQGLLAYYQAQSEQPDVLDQFFQFSPAVRDVLLQDDNLKARLLTHYRGQLEEFIQQDQFMQAEALAKRIQAVYAEANSWTVDIQLYQGRRQTELEQTYQQECMEADTNLHEKTPCLLNVHRILKNVNPQHPLLKSTELAEAFQAEVAKLLLDGAHDEAEDLLDDWGQLYPQANPERDKLLWQLERSLLIEVNLEQGNYYEAQKQAVEALALYPDSEKFKQYAEEVEKLRTQRIQAVEQHFQAALDKEILLPDSAKEDIFDFREELLRLAPDHELLSADALHQTFFNVVIEEAAKPQNLEKVQALFTAWNRVFKQPRYILPVQQELLERAQNRVALQYLLEAEQTQDAKYAEFALSLNPVSSVATKLQSLLSTLKPKAETAQAPTEEKAEIEITEEDDASADAAEQPTTAPK